MLNLILFLIGSIAVSSTSVEQTEIHATQSSSEAQTLFHYYLDELARDETLSHLEQHQKVEEFERLAQTLSPEVTSCLTSLLLQETRLRIVEMLHNAQLDSQERRVLLTDAENALHKVRDVETARQMLFFVAELKIHRQYVYEFGVALECPEKQLLRHDLCKLSTEQFESYARYFRGGKKENDKPTFLAAWEIHQCEEHHLESYRKKGCNIDHFSEEQLQNNMLETTADMLAATKQRGGGPLTDWLVNVFPNSDPHPRLLPFLEEGLKKAHALFSKDLPCWNADVEKSFKNLRNAENSSS